MSRCALVRGFSGVLLASLWVSTACSSSDGPATTPEGDGGAPLAAGGAASNAGKGGKGGAGGRAGAGGGAHAGAQPTGDAGSVSEPSGGAGGVDAGAGAGPDAGSGGETASGCEPSNDRCPAGQYCSDKSNTCVAGCKDDTSCASGVCGTHHDCQNCISDQECSEARVCGAGQCASACSAEQEGTNQGCGVGLTCCSEHCVSTASDQQHCGACGTACNGTQFCGQEGCVAARLSSLCEVGKLAVVLDGQDGDDPTGRALSQALVTHCATSQTSREVSQTVADVLNPSTGQPVSGGAELLLIAGGNYFQKAMGYLVANKVSPLTNLGTFDTYEIHDSASNALIASERIADVSDSHDLFAVQFIRDPSSSSLILNAYGFTVGGTAAATYYFTDVIAPNLATTDKAWFVGEWTDKDADKQPDLDELTLISSGG